MRIFPPSYPMLAERKQLSYLLLALITLLAVGLVSPAVAGSFTESFTTTTFKDAASTTADWNTTAGELRLFPLPALAGAYNTTGNSYDVAVAGDLAFVADDVSGLQIIDITNPASPTLKGTYNTPGNAWGVAVAGDLAFVADFAGDLQIIDVTNPASPTLKGTCTTPGYVYGVAVAGDLAFVTEGTFGLQIIDITNPASPVLKGVYNTSGSADGVVVAGKLAFVADGSSGLQIIDITNPAGPTLKGSYNTSGYAYDVAVEGALAFVADGTSGLQIIDISNPASPTLKGTYDTAGTAYGLVISGDLAFVADNTSGLQIIDITNPASPALKVTYDTPGYALDVAIAGEQAFVADNANGLQIIDVLKPTSDIWYKGAYETPGTALDVAVAGDLAFVADYTGGLQIIDITNPASPTLKGTYATAGYAFGVAVAGDLAFVADGSSGLLIIDISNPASPTLKGSYNTPGSGGDVAVAGNLAFVADGSSGLQIIDITNPASPTLKGTYATPSLAVDDVAVAGDLAFVAAFTGGLQIIDITNPASPTLKGTYATGGYAYGVAAAGDLAFVACASGGLQIIDITNPASPTLRGTCSTPNWASSVSVAGDLAFVVDGGLQIIDISNPASPTLIDHFTRQSGSEAEGVVVVGELALVAQTGLGLVSYEVLQDRFYSRKNVGRSVAVDGGYDAIVRARLAAHWSGWVSWALSADGGANFMTLYADNAWRRFDYPGSELQWRSTHNILVDEARDPIVRDLTLEWLNEFGPITSITDVPGDQGGRVRLRFTRSGYDFADETASPVTGYNIYRRVGGALMARVFTGGERLAPGARLRTPSGNEAFPLAGVEAWVLDGKAYVTAAPAGAFPSGTWALVGTAFATQSDTYIVEAATDGDSTASGGIDWSVYLVTTHTTTPSVWFASRPDSGYSVDNIAPGVPGGFMASYSGGGVQLRWAPAPESDFQYFRVYRSTDPDFVPGPATLVQQTASTSWLDNPPAPGSVYYKLTALDHAGNESGATSPASVTSVGEGRDLPKAFALHAAGPNPVRASARIGFDLPTNGGVSLEVFDVRGRLVRTLVARRLPAGRHEVEWDGSDGVGRKLAAGVYLYRLRSGHFEATRRIVLIQ